MGITKIPFSCFYRKSLTLSDYQTVTTLYILPPECIYIIIFKSGRQAPMYQTPSYKYYLPGPNNEVKSCNTPVNSIIIIGANGSGKSKLGAWIEQQDLENIHRISAQRNINFSERIPLKSFEEAEKSVFYGGAEDVYRRNKDPRWGWGKNYTTTLLNDFDDVLAALIAQLNNENQKYVEDCKLAEKQNEKKPHTIETTLDKLFSIWNQVFPQRRLSMSDAHFVASLPEGGPNYSGTQMSDGERSVLYLAAQVLCVPKNKTIIIDEPEVHLHPSLMGRLWQALESVRKDCLFIFITHDTQLATLHSESDKIWVRSFDGSSWDLIRIPESELPQQLLLELLGNRKNVLFVEGTSNSYDVQLYSVLYPDYYVVPCGGCTQVISYTKAFAATNALHSLTAYGIVDRDYRSNEEISALRLKGVFCLEVAEIENLFLVEPVLQHAANRFACSNASDAINQIKEYVIHQRFGNELDKQIQQATVARLKEQLNGVEIGIEKNVAIPDSFKKALSSINPEAERIEQTERYSKAQEAADYEHILKLYNAKGLASSIGHFLGVNDKEYCSKILYLLRGDDRDELFAAMRPYVPNLP